MIVTKHKHLLRAEAEYGHLVAMCGKTISSRALAEDLAQANCSICLVRNRANHVERSNVTVLRGSI